MAKRKLSVDTDDELEVHFKNLGNKQSKSSAGSSPNSPYTVSTPAFDHIESVEMSSNNELKDDTPFVDLTILTSRASSSTLSDATTDIMNISNEPTTEDTMVVDEPDSAPTPAPKGYVVKCCTVKFSELYYLDIQIPFTHPDLFFDLTQDPIFWFEFFNSSPHTRHTSNPDIYINHCLSTMCHKTGDVRDLLVVIVFAFITNDNDDTFHFWWALYHRCLGMLGFRNAYGQEIIYIGRIDMPDDLYSGCWNKALQEHLEDHGHLGPYVYYSVDFESGFRWHKVEDAERFIKAEDIDEHWVVELPRNEYTC
ncbi:hypothetical protein EAF04_005132 [Stromatinia cepivora]|nr:hypothetical protein EAF04_005132 [Stromatinia cepivora]